MRLYRGLKNSYRPELVDLARRSGTDFTDCPAVALRYADGPRGVLLVVDVDSDEHAAPARVTQEFWLDRDAKRFMIWGRFDRCITAVFPAKELRTRLRREGLRNAGAAVRAHLLRALVCDELRDRRLRSELSRRFEVVDRVGFPEQIRVTSHER
jgi:hypothetical protein